MKRIAIVGCGVVGASWALVFARAGHEVAIYDASPDARMAAYRFVVETLGSDGQSFGLDRISLATNLSDALAGSFYIQESVSERLEIKQKLYSELDEKADPDVILASSTSGLPASSFTSHLQHARRCLVVHPINPPHLIPLVEIVPSLLTDVAVVERTAELMLDIGQSPIKLNKEINGFVVNRLQSALLGEAFRLVQDGICSSIDVDKAVSDGLGLRWFFMGPFETIDLNAKDGIVEYCRNLGPMYYGLAKEQADPREWTDELVCGIERERRTLLAESSLDIRRNWRDNLLTKLLKEKRRLIG